MREPSIARTGASLLALVAACGTAAPVSPPAPDPLPAPAWLVSTRAGVVAVRESGLPDGRPLILLHAAAHDHRDFDSIVVPLAKRYRVIAVDWPGHGEAPMPADPSSFGATQVADALEDLTASLDTGPAILIGNSVGGFAAARLAARQPSRVRALVLVDAGGFGDLGWIDRTFCRLKGTETVTRWLWNALPEHYLAARNPQVDAILARMRAHESAPSVALNAALWRSFLEPGHDLLGEAAKIQAPTLLVWGEKDPVLPVSDGERAAKAIAGARLVRLATGHMPFAEDPPAFLAAVMPFLESLS